jgi:DNA-binding NarL/FixJ family response regulator
VAADAHVADSVPQLTAPIDGPTARRILVVDDHEMARTGLRLILSRQDWIARCLGAANGAQAVELARGYAPHVALVDVLLGTESGLDVCRALVREDPAIRVILMSGSGRVSRPVAAAVGARGFFPKDWSSDAIVAAVHRISAGKTLFLRSDDAKPTQQLSRRELDVLQQLVSGLSNREVASALYLSRHTVKQHTCSLYRKLGVRNRAEAASHARLLGLVQ